MVGKVDKRQQLVGSCTPLAARSVPESGHDVAACRQMRKERVLLKDDTDCAAMRRSECPGRGIAPRLEPGLHHGVTGTMQAGNAAQDGGLAAARRPEDGEDVAGITGEFEIEGNGRLLSQTDRQATISHD